MKSFAKHLSQMFPKLFCKKGVLENFAVEVSFLIKLQAPPTTLLKKEAQTKVFSCTFSEIFQNTSLTEHRRGTASDISQQETCEQLLTRYFVFTSTKSL